MKEEQIRKKLLITLVCIATVLIAAIVAIYIMNTNKTYSADIFGIEVVKSSVDYNQNGIDDYTDILNGARKDAENHPTYDSRYWNEGYPPDNIGVCADVIWRAFAEAGYCLRDMIDADIASRIDSYTTIDTPDSNIDFRRVRNLRVYFDEFAEELTTDIFDISEWQPGDIVIFGNNVHIGIISDRRNAFGIPYVIHNGGQEEREEDILFTNRPTAHYRFDASKISSLLLYPYTETESE